MSLWCWWEIRLIWKRTGTLLFLAPVLVFDLVLVSVCFGLYWFSFRFRFLFGVGTVFGFGVGMELDVDLEGIFCFGFGWFGISY
jgi:hypothetical protein